MIIIELDSFDLFFGTKLSDSIIQKSGPGRLNQHLLRGCNRI